MQLHAFIIHKITKTKESRVVTSLPRQSLIPNDNQLANTLVAQIIERFKKDPSHTFAKFGQQSEFAENILSIINLKINEEEAKDKEFQLTKDDLFYGLSRSLLSKLEIELQEEYAKFATGGILAIASITEDNSPYFLVTLLKENQGFAVSEALEIAEVTNIDLNHIHFAVKVDITLWQQDQQQSDNENRYLEFLKGKSRLEVVKYFRSILPIDDSTYIDPDKNTKTIVKAIKKFCLITPDLNADSICKQLHEMFDNASRNNLTITLRSIAEIITPTDQETQENEFIKYLQKTKINIDSDITPKSGTFDTLVELKVISDNYTLIIKRDGIDHDIIPNRLEKQITLKNVKDEIFDQLIGKLPE